MKQTWLAAFAFALALSSASAQVANRAQWDESLGQYAIEDGAKVIVGVDSEAYGQVLSDLWNDAHPEAPDAVRTVVLSSSEVADKLLHRDWSTPDVVIASPSDLLPVAGQLAVLDGNLAKLVNDGTVLGYYQAANQGFSDIALVPLTYRGLVFGWNPTLLKSLGIDVGPVTPENLPRQFDTWEKILALAKDWQSRRPSSMGKVLNRVFPLPLDSLRRGYSFATVAGWSIFKEENLLKPGFEKPEFLAALEFVRSAAESRLAVGSSGSLLPGNQMVVRGDELLTDASLPFGLVGTWFDVRGAAAEGRVLQFGALPTWKGVRPASWASVRVGGIDGQTNYPSAASELLRLLYTKKGTQAVVDRTPLLPVVRPKADIAPDYSQNRLKAQMLAALGFSSAEPAAWTAANAEKPALGVLDDPAILQALQDVWDGTKTPSEAQSAIVAAAEQWIASNTKTKS